MAAFGGFRLLALGGGRQQPVGLYIHVQLLSPKPVSDDDDDPAHAMETSHLAPLACNVVSTAAAQL